MESQDYCARCSAAYDGPTECPCDRCVEGRHAE